MLHPAGSIYGPVVIRDKLKFKAHEAQTQITPPASVLKIPFILQCLSFSLSVDRVRSNLKYAIQV